MPNVAIVYSLSTIASKTAGVGTYDITGTALDDNYSITFTGGENAYEITKRNLTVTVVVNDKQYDGLNTASIKSVILNNVANNDSIVSGGGLLGTTAYRRKRKETEN